MKLFIIQVMTAMAEPAEIPVLSRPVEPEGVMAAIEEEASLVEAFENNFEISQGVKPAASAASEETESREKPDDDDEDDRQQDEEKQSPPEGQPTVDPPAAEPSSTETKWALGAACRAEWSEDRTVYPAIVVSLDGERCRVRFNDYGNYKDLALSELKAPDDAPQTPIQHCQKPPLEEEDHWIQSKAVDWKPGSRCRAVYSEDGMFYPALVLWVKGERCCVRFNGYENEEEQEVSALLSLGALHGNSIGAAAKGSNWKPSATTSGSKTNVDWKRRRREENQGGRAGREENQGERAGREENQGERAGRESNQGERGERAGREENQGERAGREENQGERAGREENQGEIAGREENQGERAGREENQGERAGREGNQGERAGREENQGERAGREGNQGERAGRERRSGGREQEQQQYFSWLKASNTHQSKVEKESEEKQNDETQTPPNMFSFFPPFAPPPPGSGDSVSFIPSPPPLWAFGSSAGADASSNMLMLWYMCGFHTGSYMAQQAFNSNSTD
nr:uncharacterized protein LOC117442296 [Pseudochaenichthys georgianus]